MLFVDQLKRVLPLKIFSPVFLFHFENDSLLLTVVLLGLSRYALLLTLREESNKKTSVA
jgi:hypothetical protein